MSTYYDILRVPEDADDKGIKAAYKQAALAYHPDHIPKGVSKRMKDDAAQAWLEIQEAFTVLSDPAKREEYDTLLEEMRRAEEIERQFEPAATPPSSPQPKPSGNPGPQDQTPPAPTPPPPAAKRQSFWGPSNTPFGSITLITGGIGCFLLLGGFGENQTTVLPGLTLISLSFALLCWRHGMRPGTDPKILGGSVFLFIFTVMFFAGWIESPSSNSKQTNSTLSQGATSSALPAPITTAPCGKASTEACVSTVTPNKLAATGSATNSSNPLNPKPQTQSNPITATAKDLATESITLSKETPRPQPLDRSYIVVLASGERIRVIGYQLLGDKYRLQLIGGWMDVSASDVVSIEPEPPTKQTALPVKTWKNLRDGQIYETRLDGESLYLYSITFYTNPKSEIASCKFHRAITVGLSWAGECRERNPKDKSIYKSDATITTFSDTRIDMGTGDMTMFAMIPSDGVPNTTPQNPTTAMNQAPPSSSPTMQTPRQESATLANGTAPAHLDMSSLSVPEQQSIELACTHDKLMNGPAAYNRCLENQLRLLSNGPRRPNLTALTGPELQSIESACTHDKLMNGAAAYNRCLLHQLELLKSSR